MARKLNIIPKSEWSMYWNCINLPLLGELKLILKSMCFPQKDISTRRKVAHRMSSVQFNHMME